jgi:hypothetical protein
VVSGTPIVKPFYSRTKVAPTFGAQVGFGKDRK